MEVLIQYKDVDCCYNDFVWDYELYYAIKNLDFTAKKRLFDHADLWYEQLENFVNVIQRDMSDGWNWFGNCNRDLIHIYTLFWWI